MLAKNDRLSRALFIQVIKTGKTFRTGHFLSKVLIDTKEKGFKAGVSVSKKIAKKANVRNKLRRTAYRELLLQKNKIPKNTLLVISFLSPCNEDEIKKEVNEIISSL